MVRATFSQHWRGSEYAKDELIPADEKQEVALVKCGRAYYDIPDPITPDMRTIPTMDNTKSEIMVYLEADGIEFDKTLTKSELLELC
jgi:hypothetical protein